MKVFSVTGQAENEGTAPDSTGYPSAAKNVQQPDMPKSPEPRPSLRRLLWHCMMGMTLGIVFAGLLLDSGLLQAKGLIEGPLTKLTVLRILLTVAFVFGLGAALTGAMFLVNDKSEPLPPLSPRSPVEAGRRRNAEDRPPGTSNPAGWGFGIFAVILAVVILGWTWGRGQGRNWGNADRLAHVPPPASNSAGGAAAKAWNRP